MSDENKAVPNPVPSLDVGVPDPVTTPGNTPSDIPAQVAATIDNPMTPTPFIVSDMGSAMAVNVNVENPNGYPVILGGDHAEFEAEWAGKDPKTRPDWPLPSMDAVHWAESFADRFKGKILVKREELIEDMVGWFANSMMRGYDGARAHAAVEFDKIQEGVLNKFTKERDALIAKVEADKHNITEIFNDQIDAILAEAKEKGKFVWAKYGTALVLGIIIGSTFSEYFIKAATTVTP